MSMFGQETSSIHPLYNLIAYANCNQTPPVQLLPRLSTGVMLELERILENKPIRPPAISTLALR